MRKYQQVWNLIKESINKTPNCVALTAHHSHHRRIKKAVGKEKLLDMDYTMQLADKGLVARLDMESQGSKITFKLIIKDDLTFID